MAIAESIGWVALVAVLAAVFGARLTLWKAQRTPAPAPAPAPEDIRRNGEARARQEARAGALDAVSEAVLLVTPEGRVEDCNSAALSLFDRHRPVMEGAYASALRTLEYQGENPQSLAEVRNVWAGESWVRQSDGSVRLCLMRIVPVRDERGETRFYVESYRDVLKDGVMGDELRDLLYGIRAEDSRISGSRDANSGVNEELQELGVAFRDIDRVVREYERLLPNLSASDPVTEVLAGSATRIREAAGNRDVSQLLATVPGLLARIRSSINRMRLTSG